MATRWKSLETDSSIDDFLFGVWSRSSIEEVIVEELEAGEDTRRTGRPATNVRRNAQLVFALDRGATEEEVARSSGLKLGTVRQIHRAHREVSDVRSSRRHRDP